MRNKTIRPTRSRSSSSYTSSLLGRDLFTADVEIRGGGVATQVSQGFTYNDAEDAAVAGRLLGASSGSLGQFIDLLDRLPVEHQDAIMSGQAFSGNQALTIDVVIGLLKVSDSTIASLLHDVFSAVYGDEIEVASADEVTPDAVARALANSLLYREQMERLLLLVGMPTRSADEENEMQILIREFLGRPHNADRFSRRISYEMGGRRPQAEEFFDSLVGAPINSSAEIRNVLAPTKQKEIRFKHEAVIANFREKSKEEPSGPVVQLDDLGKNVPISREKGRLRKKFKYKP